MLLCINLFLSDPQFDKLSDKANFELNANQPELAEKTLQEIVFQDSLNIRNHYRYIINHFNIPLKRAVAKRIYEHRDDKKIQDFYNALALSSDAQLKDIACMGKGLIHLEFDKYTDAIVELKKIKNKDLAYFSNAMGVAYLQIDSQELAEYCFKLEIEKGGDLSNAYFNLMNLLLEQNRMLELQTLLNDPETHKYVPSNVERAIYFKTFQPLKYGNMVFKRVLSNVSIWSVIAALLILLSWVTYLRKLDIFETEKWKYIVVAVLLGMGFSFLAAPFSDINKWMFGFYLNGEFVNDFLFSALGIGVIEELVKIVPLLLLMKFTKEVNEPYDYIFYASLSALGFAFIENLVYFNSNHPEIIHGRAMSAAVAHMFNSSIIAYGIVLNKYRFKRNPFIVFVCFFALAAISHGFYDFWLISQSVTDLQFWSIIYFLMNVFMWNSFKNNALNHSDFFNKKKFLDNGKILDHLIYSLSGIFIFEVILIAIKFGPNIANNEMLSSIISGSYLIIFLSLYLSKFTIIEGKWAPINLFGREPEVYYDGVLNLNIQLKRITDNDCINSYLPNSGEIIKRVTVLSEPDWYLVKLDAAASNNNSMLSDTILIRTKNKTEIIERGKKTIIALFMIQSNTNIHQNQLSHSDFKFCAWAIIY